jgi:hypothetical protein
MFGLIFNKGALWIGAHYSPFNRRWCINVLPCGAGFVDHIKRSTFKFPPDVSP